MKSDGDNIDSVGCYPDVTKIDRLQLSRLVEDAVDWAHAHGMVMRTASDKSRSDICQTAPFTLLPSPFPKKLYTEAMDIQQAVNLLYFRVSWDFDFLIKAHAEVVKTDDFTRHFVNILQEVREASQRQTKTLLIQRNDYMCQKDFGNNFYLKQIEVNNIAASMGSHSERVTHIHKKVLNSLGVSEQIIDTALPENTPIDTIARGIFLAWQDYGDSSAVVLFIVDPENQNQIDQRHVEYCLDEISDGNIKCERLTFTESAKRLTIDKRSQRLLLDGNNYVSVVYFRSGYLPESYPTEAEWSTRRTIELSDAVKCPWIGLQLANTKKIQQVLSEEGVLERYLADVTMCKRIRATFARMWGLEADDEKTEAAIKDAIAHPGNYVLKPQLEGGGGNYYGKEVAAKMKSFKKDELAAHILMERIRPMVVKNYLIRPMQEPLLCDVVGELGIYACLYGSPGQSGKDEHVVVNFVNGHIIRSKGKDVDKGGIAIGAAVIDSAFLF